MSKACATWPISSAESTPTGSTVTSTSCGSLSERVLTSSGRRRSATSSAEVCRRVSERTIERATRAAPAMATMSTRATRAALMTDSVSTSDCSDWALPSRTSSRLFSIDFSALTLAVDLSNQSL